VIGGALQGLSPGRVALLGSVSKTLAPALRLGWIACPPQLAGPIADGKRYDDRGCPALDQIALAALLESGRFDRHLRRMRTIYAARRGALTHALRVHAPRIQITGLAAGFHAVASLPDRADEHAVTSSARAPLHRAARRAWSGLQEQPRWVPHGQGTCRR
jgi:GntR family transcriptional regulator / MocR family aminotransferase